MDATAYARKILAENGCVGEPHPALLADTVREVEYAVQMGRLTLPAPVIEIVKDEFEVPCEHPTCVLLHKPNVPADHPHLESYWLPNGTEKTKWVTGYHARTVTQWVILVDGERHPQCEGYDTRREARAKAATI